MSGAISYLADKLVLGSTAAVIPGTQTLFSQGQVLADTVLVTAVVVRLVNSPVVTQKLQATDTFRNNVHLTKFLFGKHGLLAQPIALPQILKG